MRASEISEAAEALRTGQAVVFPTDTVYGIGVAVAFAPDPHALYRAKGRPANKPIPWLIGSTDDLLRYGADVPAYALDLARQDWPGALTLVVRASEAVPRAYRSAADTIALRVPDSPEALALIQAVGCPLATTSANLSGGEPPCSFDAVDSQLLAACGAAVASSDALCSGEPSAIFDCTGAAPLRLR